MGELSGDVPHEVPAATGHFVNRDDELAAIAGHPARVAVVTGPPGVGKTAIAYRFAEQFGGRYPGGQLFVDLAGYRTPDGTAVDDAVAGCLRSIGVSTDVIPASGAERTNLYRTRTSSKPMLVIIDQVTEYAQVTPLIPGAAGSLVLVTTNDQLTKLVLDGANVVAVKPLTLASGLRLLTLLCGADRVDAEPEQAAELVRLSGYLPIAIRVAAGRLIERRGLLIADLVAEIRRLGLSAFTLGGESPVAAVFTAVYQDLPPATARMYRLLSRVPGVDFTVEVAAAAADVESDVAADRLNELVGVSLVSEETPGRFKLLGLIRQHAAECAVAGESDERLAAAFRRIVQHYLVWTVFGDLTVLGPGRYRCTPTDQVTAGHLNPFHDKKTALDRMDAERPNILAVMREAAGHGLHVEASQLAEAASALYVSRRYLTDWVESAELGALSARLAGTSRLEARLRSFSSRAYVDLGRGDRAKEELDFALPIAEQAGDARLLASIWELIGRYRESVAEYESAIDAFDRAIAIFDTFGDNRGVAFVSYFRGMALSSSGRHEDALAGLRTAVPLIQSQDDPRMVGRAMTGIGIVLARLGRTAEATDELRQAVELLRDNGYAYYEAQALVALADVAEQAGDIPLAAEGLNRALEYHARSGSPREPVLRQRLTVLTGGQPT